MNKTLRIYGILFVLVALLLAFLELSKKEVLDWRKNFDTAKKTPFGLFILDKEIDYLLKNKVKRVKQSPYDYYRNHHRSSKPRNILVINRSISATSWKKILQQVEKGDDLLLFISHVPLPEFLEKYRIDQKIYSNKDAVTLKLMDKKLHSDSLVLDKIAEGYGFFHLYNGDEILGQSNDDWVNFIKLKKGKGSIYIHSEPLFLTNYYLLKKGNRRYVEGVFSHFHQRETIWFVDDSSVGLSSSSPLRVILSNPPLKYAWWLLLAGLLLFLIFNAKRRQRIVPVIEPLKNKSLEFVRSVGNLYLQEGDFHNMMEKKAQYFLYKVRTELLIDTQVLDDNFIKKLQIKTGKSPEMIEEAVLLIKKATDVYSQVIKQDLERINTLLNDILNH